MVIKCDIAARCVCKLLLKIFSVFFVDYNDYTPKMAVDLK